MGERVELLLYTAVIPMLTAAAAAWVARRGLPPAIAQRYWLGLALAVGFVIGYWLLPDRPPLVPVKHWHWLPYLAAMTLAGGLTSAGDASWIARLLVYVAVALVAAWKLVPHWEDLQPPWHYTVSLLAGYFLLLTAFLVALPDRLLGRLFVGLLCASAGVTALLITIGFSVKYGQVAAIAAAGLAGCCLMAFLPIPKRSVSEGTVVTLPTAIRGLIPVFTILVGGLAFVGAIEPTPKTMPIFLVAPATTLMLWLFAAGPLSRLQGPSAAAAQTAAVLLPLIIALAIVALGSGEEELGRSSSNELLVRAIAATYTVEIPVGP
jgi:hypothetical protein